MNERKIQKEFTDRGFGFPVRLRNVPMVRVRGVWTPEVNYEKLASAVLKALSMKPVRLTGNEVRFIRLQAQLTVRQFAERFCVPQSTVDEWEIQGENSTKMHWSTEKDIRLFLLLATHGEEHFVQLYRKLEQEKAIRKWTSSIDVRQLAA
ncbi:MAG: hypothetical protein GY835_03015 [bacterium]|nr:hypothetical protein [bacterium]